MQQFQIDFAPLQGFTDATFRNAHAALFGGVDSYHTPFLRIERGDFRTREVRDALPDNNTVPHLVPQAIAAKGEELERIVVKLMELEYREVDINMGCPYPLMARKGRGSGILSRPEQVAELLALCEKYREVSFSVKLRLGWESADEAEELLPLLNATPLSRVTLHPRLGKQQYKGECDMEAFARFYEACQHPLFYNGDITTTEQIAALTARYPRLAGVMIGRGLLANPALAAEYRLGEPMARATLYQKLGQLHAAMLNHYSNTLQGDAQILSHLKPQWEYWLPEADRKLKKRIHKSNSLSNYTLAVEMLLNDKGEE